MRAKTTAAKKAKPETPAERDAREDREHEEMMASLRQEQEARVGIVTATVAAAADAQAHLELEAANDGPDPASAALVTHTLRTQGVRPVASNQPGGTTCPECGQPLIIAPRGGDWIRGRLLVPPGAARQNKGEVNMGNGSDIMLGECMCGLDASWYRTAPAPPPSERKGKSVGSIGLDDVDNNLCDGCYKGFTGSLDAETPCSQVCERAGSGWTPCSASPAPVRTRRMIARPGTMGSQMRRIAAMTGRSFS